jgi:parallel beta-helix repeat protein
VVFDGNGHKIDGDDTGEFESGITMSSKSGNTIKNCNIADFESGITLYGSSKNKIYDNKVSSNSDLNNIHDNLIGNNGKYGIYFSSDSNNNIFSKLCLPLHTTTGIEETEYTRPGRQLFSFTFHPGIPEKLYYVNAIENKIYRTHQTGFGWAPEEVIYTHTTNVNDIAFA